MRSMHFLSKLILLVTVFTLLAAPAMAQDEATVMVAENETYGPILVDSEGMTLYTFDRDVVGTSNCYDRCATAWPPLLVDSADDVTAGEGIPGVLGTTERTDGTIQVTYNGWPLYYWQFDEVPGDATGHRVGRVWWVVPPATASVSMNEELGKFLVGPTGMTLYRFDNDEPGVSNCSGDCATNWPPFTVEADDTLVAGVNLPGAWSTIPRDDGTMQVTYNDWPLYYWNEDEAIGDTNGQGVGDVWWVVHPETVVAGSTDELGSFLTSFDGMTLYTFANDEPGVSNCADDCAEAWPPFTVATDVDLTAGAGVTGELGTMEREDGALQVTYNGTPLYFFDEDAGPGDTNGQGVGDVWFVAAVEGSM